jgi:O-antigen/teichoic acid export membrane protein
MLNSSKYSFYNIALTYCTILLGFFITIAQTKVITAEEIGVLSILYTLSLTIGNIVLFGVPSAIIRYYKEHAEDDRQKIAFVIISFLLPLFIFLIVSIVLLFTIDSISNLYNNIYLSKYIQYLYFFLFATIVGKIFRGLFEVEQKPLIANILHDTVFFGLHLLFLCLMLVTDISFHFYFIFFLTLYFARLFLFSGFFSAFFPITKPDFSFLTRRRSLKYLTYCFFMFFSSMTGTLTASVDKLMLGIYLNIKMVGIYTIISSFPIVIAMIGGAFSRITHPMVALYWQKKEMKNINALYKENTNLQLFLGLYVFIFLSIFAEKVIDIFGQEYQVGAVALIILCLGNLVNLGTGICGGIIFLSKYYRFDLYTRGALVLLTIVTNMVFIPRLGLNGAAIATALSLSLYNIFKVLFVYWKLKMQPYSLQTLSIISLALVFAIFVFFFQASFALSNLFVIAFFALTTFIVYCGFAFFVFRIRDVRILIYQLIPALNSDTNP